jgi:hypothetical protein
VNRADVLTKSPPTSIAIIQESPAPISPDKVPRLPPYSARISVQLVVSSVVAKAGRSAGGETPLLAQTIISGIFRRQDITLWIQETASEPDFGSINRFAEEYFPSFKGGHDVIEVSTSC